jgi:hypothetical protein
MKLILLILKAFKEEYCRQFPELISVGTGSIYKI